MRALGQVSSSSASKSGRPPKMNMQQGFLKAAMKNDSKSREMEGKELNGAVTQGLSWTHLV